MFPQFPKSTKSHMPFVTIHNGRLVYFVCLCGFGSTKWQLYWHNGVEWKRVTDDETIECNPVAYNDTQGRLILSYTKTIAYQMHNLVYGEFDNGKFTVYGEANGAVGCYWDNKFVLSNGTLVNGIDVMDYGYDFIYAVRGSDIGLLVTVAKGKDNVTTLLVDDNHNVFEVISKKAKVYKPTHCGNEWYRVQMLNGNEQELRFVVRDESIYLKRLEK